MSTENLKNEEAISKLRKMVDDIDIGMLCSNNPESDYFHSVPMSRQEVDEEGNIWFLFSATSESHQYLLKDNKASLLYSDVKNYAFLSINGIGEISSDRARIDKYWNKVVEAWFENGKEDANVRVLKFIPTEAHYWDNKSGKLVTFLKVATSAISGIKMDIGREGDLEV